MEMKAFQALLLALFVFALPLNSFAAEPGKDPFAEKPITTPEIPVIGADGVVQTGKMEIVIGEASSPQELVQLTQGLAHDLENAQRGNPALEGTFGIVESENEIALPKVGFTRRTAHAISTWVTDHRYRVNFALARFIVGHQTTMWTLSIAKGVPLWPAFFMGVYNGVIQGGFMLFNPEWQSYIPMPSGIRKQMGIPSDTTIGRGMDGIAPLRRWILTELLFVTMAKMALLGIGGYYAIHLVPDESTGAFAQFVVWTTFLNTVGEFPWGMAINKIKAHRAAVRGWTQQAIANTQFESDIAILGLSGLGTIALIMQQMRLELGEQSLIAMAAAGWFLYAGLRYWMGPTPTNCAEAVSASAALPAPRK
jgi:hypothetical protein